MEEEEENGGPLNYILQHMCVSQKDKSVIFVLFPPIQPRRGGGGGGGGTHTHTQDHQKSKLSLWLVCGVVACCLLQMPIFVSFSIPSLTHLVFSFKSPVVWRQRMHCHPVVVLEQWPEL